jgi:hypothetical protein
MATRNQSYEHTDEVDNYDENESSDEGSHQVTISPTLYEQLFVQKRFAQLIFTYSLAL